MTDTFRLSGNIIGNPYTKYDLPNIFDKRQEILELEEDGELYITYNYLGHLFGVNYEVKSCRVLLAGKVSSIVGIHSHASSDNPDYIDSSEIHYFGEDGVKHMIKIDEYSTNKAIFLNTGKYPHSL